MKQRVMKETITIVKIYEEDVVTSQMSPQTLATMPLARELQPSFTYVRQKMTPILPDSSMFDIPEPYQTTYNNELFLARDILIRKRKRMLMFCTKTQLELLFDSSVVMMDGNFSAAPPFFDQIYAIYVVKFNTSSPCVFSILLNRKKYTYLEMFKELKNLAAQLNRSFQPSRILTDYEPSIMEAISIEFPDAIHSGCYFHLTQAVNKRVQNLNLSTSYVEDIDIRTCVRKLMALALLPLGKVQIAFDDLRTNSSEDTRQMLHQLFLYFDNHWMKSIPLALWNAHGYNHCTNSICEDFHNRLNQRIQKSHPNIWSFIKCLQGKEARFRHMLLRINAGAQRRRKMVSTNAIQQRINTLNERYTNNEIDLNELLDGLSLIVAK